MAAAAVGWGMMYLWPQASSLLNMPENIGVMTSSAHRMIPLGIQEGRKFACDNGAFTGKGGGLIDHLLKLQAYRNNFLFVVAPDVLFDAQATLDQYNYYLSIYAPVAFVAQDGQENLPFPDMFDWLFIGGSTEWKMGAGARLCIERAHKLGKPVHAGRVNSKRRYQYFQKLGVKSCDGTHPIFEPTAARKRITGWVSQLVLRGAVSYGDNSSQLREVLK